MFARRMDGTAEEMIASGQWARVAKSHYRHETGIEITKSKNGSGWVVSTEPQYVWSRLWVARHNAEKAATA